MEKETKTKKTTTVKKTTKVEVAPKVEEKTTKPVKKTTTKKVVKKVAKPMNEEVKSTAKIGRPKGDVRIEKEFHETFMGKFARILSIVACSIMVLGTCMEIVLGLWYREAANVEQILTAISDMTKYGCVLTLLCIVLYESFKSRNR